MMLSSILARRSPAAVNAVKSLATPSLVAFPAAATSAQDALLNHQQARGVTKKRQHRQAKRKRKEELAAQGIMPPKPPGYIPRDTPVRNAVSRQERDAESKRQDELASEQLKERMDQVQGTTLLRFGFNAEDLVMSDRVKKLFDLHNGNQKEVVKAQKQKGMELFKLRDGDTGSSAVQGKDTPFWLSSVKSKFIAHNWILYFSSSVIALTTRIQQIQTHLRQHKKDKHSKRGLDALYVRRRKLLDYMERKDFESYRKIVKTLGLIH